MANDKSQISKVSHNVGIRIEGDSVTFWLRIKPRPSRVRWTIDARGEPRLEIHAAPTDGQANLACIEFLARALRVTRSNVDIITGEKSRRKLIRVRGGAAVAAALRTVLGIPNVVT